MRAVLENAVALAVASDVRRAVLANRQRGRSPQLVAIFVANVNHLTRAVADRIVRPLRNLTLLTVDRPGVTRSFDRDLEAEIGIGDHVDPRRRRPLTFAESGHIFAAVFCESAEPVEKLHFAARGCAQDPAVRRQPPRRRRGSRLEHLKTFDLLGKRSAPAEKHRSARCTEAGFATSTETRSARRTNTPPRTPSPSEFGRAHIAPDQRLERGLQILGVGRARAR